MKTLFFMLLTALSVSAAKAQSTQANKPAPKPYTILVLMNATPKWLSLTRNERSQFVEKEITPIFVKTGKTVTIRLFDSEYFNASVSDFMIVSTPSLGDYKLLIELLRDTKIYGIPYFDIKQIIVGQENLFEYFNEQLKVEQK
jgi:hypothetical protein